jgi:hypothetical protein
LHISSAIWGARVVVVVVDGLVIVCGMDSIDFICFFSWIAGTSLSSAGCCSSSVGDDAVADFVNDSLSSERGSIGASSDSDWGVLAVLSSLLALLTKLRL